MKCGCTAERPPERASLMMGVLGLAIVACTPAGEPSEPQVIDGALPDARTGLHAPPTRVLLTPTPRPDPALSPEELNRRSNFLVIDIDSMRADRLHARHEGLPLAPHLEALAARGFEFSQAIANSGWTMPGLAALLTGRQAPIATLRPDLRSPWIDDGARTLPSILGWYGYRTAVFWGWTVPSVNEEFSIGFQTIGEETAQDPTSYSQPVTEWLGGAVGREPFFLLVHNMDLHHPWPALGETPSNLDDLARELTPEGAAQGVIGQYDASIMFYDRVVGTILDELERTGLDHRTVTIVTSNHGEALYEHGLMGHGSFHYDEVLRIPLLWVEPDVPGRKVGAQVQTIDLAPSILERAEVPADHLMDGHSLLPLMGLTKGAYAARAAASLSGPRKASLRTPAWKIMLHPPKPEGSSMGASDDGGEPVTEFFDLMEDPQETLDARSSVPDVYSRMEADLREIMALRPGGSPGIPVSEDLKRTLKERGYWEGE